MDVARQYCPTCERLSWHTRWTPSEGLLRLLVDLSVLTLGLSLLAKWGLQSLSRRSEWKCKICGGAVRRRSDVEASKKDGPSRTTRNDEAANRVGSNGAKASSASSRPLTTQVVIDEYARSESSFSDADIDAQRRASIFAVKPINATQAEFWEWHDKLYLGGSSRCPEWLQRVREVRERDGYRCVDCGAKGPEIELHTDHIIPLSAFGSNELENLKTLCIRCHEKKTGRQLRSRRR